MNVGMDLQGLVLPLLHAASRNDPDGEAVRNFMRVVVDMLGGHAELHENFGLMLRIAERECLETRDHVSMGSLMLCVRPSQPIPGSEYGHRPHSVHDHIPHKVYMTRKSSTLHTSPRCRVLLSSALIDSVSLSTAMASLRNTHMCQFCKAGTGLDVLVTWCLSASRVFAVR